MKCAYTVSALFALSACVLQAASEEDVSEALLAALEEQVELLTEVTDAASAAAALPRLKENMAALAALNGRVPENRLWLYIDNSPEVKIPLIEQLQLLSVQLVRLEQAEFYGNSALSAQLRPVFTSGAVAP